MTSTETLYTTYLSCAFPLVVVDTIEDERASNLIKSCVKNITEEIFKGKYDAGDVISQRGFTVYEWDSYNGLRDPLKGVIDSNTAFRNVLNTILNTDVPSVFILYDFHLPFQDRYSSIQYIPQLKEICRKAPLYNVQIVGIGDLSQLPPELKNYIMPLEFNYPSKAEIASEVHQLLYDKDSGYFIKYKHPKAKQERICEDIALASVGMTMSESLSALKLALVSPNVKESYPLDLQVLYDAKARCITSTGLLEYLNVEEDIDSLGGMSNFKEWVNLYIEKIFKSPEKAMKFGLKMPKGVILTGIQGTGKTLAAKWLSKKLEVKCYRCDIGRIFGSLVGETERNMRTLLQQLKVIQPAVILFDEIEKMFAGQESSSYTDSGVTARMIASFLYDTEESNSLSFKVATANNVFALSPEMLRKGRWDEIFFFDTPSFQELKDIYRIHIKASGRKPENFDIEAFAKKSNGFVGAEVESAIQLALRKAFANGVELSNEYILQEIKNVRPLTTIKKDDIDRLRDWAKDKAQLANTNIEPTIPQPQTVSLIRGRGSRVTN